MKRSEVYKLIDGERDYQDAKWGTIEQNPHRVQHWVSIALEELYALLNAMRASMFCAQAVMRSPPRFANCAGELAITISPYCHIISTLIENVSEPESR